MLDVVLVRRDPDRVRRIAARRPAGAAFVDRVVELDAELRASRTESERLKAEKNALTASIAKAADRGAEAKRLKPEIAALDERIAASTAAIPALEAHIDEILADVPNLLDDSVPDGEGDADNVLVRSVGSPSAFAFPAKQHFEIGEALGILDFERASKLSGSRFSVLRGKGAQLSRALANFFLARASARGYTEIVPPLLVSRDTMWSTGQLTKFADAMFRDADADLFMTPPRFRGNTRHTPRAFAKKRARREKTRAGSFASINSKKSNS
jgi:seryl-tRNA synthetase